MCLRINDKIIIYSIELEIPIVTLNNGIVFNYYIYIIKLC
jgi:hypothetical protein